MILVTGATGNVGREVIARLVAQGEGVRALVRRSEPVGFAPEVEVVQGDLEQPSSVTAALTGVTGVFLLGGQGDTAALLKEMRRVGVMHVVLLSSRSVLLADASNAIVRMWMTAEEAVRASGLGWTLLRPSGFASNALRWRDQLRGGHVVRLPFARAAIAAIDPHDIAAVGCAALTADGHLGQSYELSGPEALLPAEQVRILGEVLGRDLSFEAQSDEEALASFGTAPPGFADAFYRFFAKGEFDDAVVVPTVAQITGQAPRTFEQWARAHVSAFR